MTLYGIMVLLHVVAAVAGLGPTFIFPLLLYSAKSKEQLVWVNDLLAKAEKAIKIASIGLLITGLILGILHPYLFKEFWYISSIVLYFIAQIIVIGIAGKHSKTALAILDATEGSEIPKEVITLNKIIIKAHISASVIVVILVILMNVKPF